MSPTILSDPLPHYDRSAGDHPDFYYNPKSGRYHYRDKGGFVSKEARDTLTRTHIDNTRDRLRSQSDRLGKISFQRWQRDTFAQVKIAHTQSYILGRGGIHRMTAADYATLSKEMRFQRDRFKLFSKQILDGKLSEAAVQYRLTAYGEATRVSHEDGLLAAAIADGFDEERNVLAVAEHCVDCVTLANKGWVKSGTLPRPTKKRRCMFNCKCTIEYRKSAKRTDFGEGLIKKVITNVQQEKQTVYVRPGDDTPSKNRPKGKEEPSKSGQGLHSTALTLAKKTFETEELPSREELIAFSGQAIGEFMKNPVKATLAGMARERAVRDAFRQATGESIPSHGATTFKAMKSKAKELAKSADTYVAVAGITGSVVGGAVAGPAGALAGDLAGSLVVRKAFEASKAYKKGLDAIDAQAMDDAADRLKAIQKTQKATISGLRDPEIQKSMEKELVGDAAGWAIGNASGIAISSLLPSPVPYGAFVAMGTVPTVVVPSAQKAHEYVRNGMKPQEAAIKALTETLDGGSREKAARSAVTQYIRKSKAAAKTAGYTLAGLAQSAVL